MDWRPAPTALIEMIEEEMEQDCFGARYAKMPFYYDGYLVEAELQDSLEHLVFGGQGGLMIVPLDGSAEQLRMANRVGGLVIMKDNVGEYLRFFCAHLASFSGAAFEMFEHAEGLRLDNGHKTRNLRLRVCAKAWDGEYRLGGYQRAEDKLYRASFRVAEDGMVRMVKAVMVGRLVTLN